VVNAFINHLLVNGTVHSIKPLGTSCAESARVASTTVLRAANVGIDVPFGVSDLHGVATGKLIISAGFCSCLIRLYFNFCKLI